MTTKHFLNLKDLSNKDILNILDRGIERKSQELKEKTLLGSKLGLIFEKPSTRTRISFESGILNLGGNAIFMSSSDLQLSRGEPVSDTAKVSSSMLDIFALRVDKHETLEIFAANSSVPVINALSDLSHPCQILADLMTYKEISANKLEKVCWIGDGDNVCNSYVEASKILDFELSIFCPKEHSPNPSFLEFAKETTNFANSREKAAKGADIITTDVWVSMGDKKTKEKAFEGYFVDTELIENTGKKSIFLHCLPAHRGQEITFELMEHPLSKVLEQAENRMHVQEALIENLLGQNFTD